jgi:hypothetical protein
MPNGPREVVCQGCNSAFTAFGNRAIYCSVKCRRRTLYRSRTSDYRDKQLSSSARCQTARKSRRWTIIFERHGNKCGRCGFTYPRCVYDLHHPIAGVKGSRKENSAVVIHGGSDVEFERLMEITVLLCANCHRLEHNTGRPYGQE